MSKKEQYSHSKLEAFNQCALKYKYRYIEKNEEFKPKENVSEIKDSPMLRYEKIDGEYQVKFYP